MAQITVEVVGLNIHQWRLNRLINRGIEYEEDWFKYLYTLDDIKWYDVTVEKEMPEEEFFRFIRKVDLMAGHMEMHVLPVVEGDYVVLELKPDDECDEYRGCDSN